MKERPVLFSATMVRALLSGAKTQTRRIACSGDLVGVQTRDGTTVATFTDHCGDDPLPLVVTCRQGAPGDKLWVKETWGLHAYGDFTYWNRESVAGRSEDDVRGSWEVAYAADATSVYDHWRPSIHMPRWASRLTLEVTGVRVERLQAITEADAKAEGVTPAPFCKAGRAAGLEHVEAFEELWGDINGAESWAANPWVWVVSFRRVTP